jgi:hypothetical protein
MHLRNLAEAAIEQVAAGDYVLAASGSVARQPLIRKLIGIDFEEPQHPPEWGAVLWARENLGSR